MAEKIKRVKASTIPVATTTQGFNAIGIRENLDGSIDNVKVPMRLLKSELTSEQIDEINAEIGVRIEATTGSLLSNYLGFEIDEDMNLVMSTPDNYHGPEFVLENGELKVII